MKNGEDLVVFLPDGRQIPLDSPIEIPDLSKESEGFGNYSEWLLSSEREMPMRLVRRGKDYLILKTLDGRNRIVVSFDASEMYRVKDIKSGYKHGDIITCKFSF